MNAVFFDLDGTLIDSRADLAATVNHTRRELGLEPIASAEVLRHVGQGAKHLLANAIPEHQGETERLWEIFRSHYAEHMLESVALYPGVVRTLSVLRERGWLLGINTAKPNFAVRAILDHLGVLDFFGEAIVAGGDCPEMKPSALPLRECAARMGGHVLSSRDWMVGDHWTDMQCAANAGVKGAFCEFGFGNLRDSSCVVRLKRMDELLLHCLPE